METLILVCKDAKDIIPYTKYSKTRTLYIILLFKLWFYFCSSH